MNSKPGFAAMAPFAVLSILPGLLLSESTDLDSARSLLDRGEFAQAREILEKVSPANRDTGYQFLMGKLSYRWGEYNKAAEWLVKATSGNPSNSDYFLWLGRTEGRKAEKASIFAAPSLARRARDAFQKAVALDPENLDARDDLLSYYLDAPGFLGGGKDKARALVEEVRTAHPCQYHVQLAEIYQESKGNSQAELELMKAVEVEPHCLKGHVALAHFYKRQGRLTQAREVLQKVGQLFPNSSQAHFAIGRLEVETSGDLKKASQELELSLRTYVSGEPYPFEARYWLARAFLILKQPEKARQQFQLALKSFPVHEPSIKGLEEARRLR